MIEKFAGINEELKLQYQNAEKEREMVLIEYQKLKHKYLEAMKKEKEKPPVRFYSNL